MMAMVRVFTVFSFSGVDRRPGDDGMGLELLRHRGHEGQGDSGSDGGPARFALEELEVVEQGSTLGCREGQEAEREQGGGRELVDRLRGHGVDVVDDAPVGQVSHVLLHLVLLDRLRVTWCC